MTTDQTVWLAAGTEIETQTSVSIGAGTTIQRRAGINGTVRIGAGCILAPNVFISSGAHPFRHIAHLPIREQERRLSATPEAFEALNTPVWIQGDCWLGVNSVICPGVTLGKGGVVGANAVVTRSVAPYSVVGGRPRASLARASTGSLRCTSTQRARRTGSMSCPAQWSAAMRVTASRLKLPGWSR
ncbi:acyltransferase [Sphaerotilaceae bacterium SBD11-9]